MGGINLLTKFTYVGPADALAALLALDRANLVQASHHLLLLLGTHVHIVNTKHIVGQNVNFGGSASNSDGRKNRQRVLNR